MPKRKAVPTKTASGATVGRPRTEPDPAVLESILAHIAAGKSLESWCQEKADRPTARTVRFWREQNPEFASAFARAREDGCDAIAAQALAIADDGGNDTVYDDEGRARANSEWIARSRLRVDTRLKLLACWSSRYSPQVRHAGAEGGPVKVELTDMDRRARIASILAAGQERLAKAPHAAEAEDEDDDGVGE